MSLPEDDYHTFDIFRYWLEFREVKLQLVYSDQELAGSGVHKLLQCWVFGDKMMAPYFKNSVIHSLVSVYSSTRLVPGPGTVDFVYDNSPGECGMRRALVDRCIWYPNRDWIARKDWAAAYRPDFVSDCFTRYVAAAKDYGLGSKADMRDVAPSSSRICTTYHEHVQGDKVPCCETDEGYGEDEQEEEDDQSESDTMDTSD